MACIFDVFSRARVTTKVIEEAEDIDGFADLKQEDRKLILGKIDELQVIVARKVSVGADRRTLCCSKS